MILARLMVLVLVCLAVHAISVDDVRKMSAESRKAVETKIADHVQSEIELVAKSSAQTTKAFDLTRKPFDDHPNPVQFMRDHLAGFEVVDNKHKCSDPIKNVFPPIRECSHIVNVSW